MPTTYTPVYKPRTPDELVITDEAARLAKSNSVLFEKFLIAVRNNAQQGTILLDDPDYYNLIKTQYINNIDEHDLLTYKRIWGRRILRDADYLDKMTRLAIVTALGGFPTIDSQFNQTVEAYIPAKITDGDLDLTVLNQDVIENAVGILSNQNILLKILVASGEFRF